MAELFALHRLLAAVPKNVNQMAWATNVSGEIQAETAATLKKDRVVTVRIEREAKASLALKCAAALGITRIRTERRRRRAQLFRTVSEL